MTGQCVAARWRSARALIVLVSIPVFVWALGGALPALAGERVHFKNGHILEVVSSRTDGTTIFLKLPDNSEIGVPTALIAEIEGGREVSAVGNARPIGNFAGRGPALTDLIGYKQLEAQNGQRIVGEVSRQALSQYKKTPNQPMTFGFSWRGSGDIADMNLNKGPQERANDRTAPGEGSAMGWNTAGAAHPDVNPGSVQPKKTDPDPKNGPP